MSIMNFTSDLSAAFVCRLWKNLETAVLATGITYTIHQLTLTTTGRVKMSSISRYHTVTDDQILDLLTTAESRNFMIKKVMWTLFLKRMIVQMRMVMHK
jgi:hypothetical protein